MKNPDDIETLGRLPSLAVVPTFLSTNGHSLNRSPKLLKSKATNGNGTLGLVSHQQPQSQMAEAFRALRTSLLLSQADRPPQVILITSPLPHDGKTTAAVNLALTLAKLGDRTLLVDGDIRKPGVCTALSMPDGKHVGLSSYLAGVSALDLIITPHPSISNLAIISSGPIPPNPADLLSSHRLDEMVAQLRNQFKFIVIDSPPVLVATDPVILSVAVDGVLLVVRSGKTPKEAFVRARDLLASVKCRTLGVVLNGVDATGHDYYYSYRYYPYAYSAYGNEGEGRPEKEGNELGA
jgi:capsular exopolysaccharide synthesis family protein